MIFALSSQAQFGGLVMNQLMRYFNTVPGPECGCEVHDASRVPGTSRPADFSLITVEQIVISLIAIGLDDLRQAAHSSGVGDMDTLPSPVITVHSSKISFGQLAVCCINSTTRQLQMARIHNQWTSNKLLAAQS